MKIYISIPITGHSLNQVKTEAKRIAGVLKSKFNASPVTPFDIVTSRPEKMTEQEFYAHCMALDIKELLRCDAIYMAYGWQHSKGCRAEHAIAQIYDIQIIKYEELKI